MTGGSGTCTGTGTSPARATRTGEVDRRTLLRGAVLTLGAGALTACGDDAPSAPPPGSPLAALQEVPEGSALPVTSDDGPLLLVRTSGDEVRAYSAVCPHQGCTVAPVDDRLVCPCHGSAFDLATGAVLQGPADADLTAVPVTVVDGDVVRD